MTEFGRMQPALLYISAYRDKYYLFSTSCTIRLICAGNLSCKITIENYPKNLDTTCKRLLQ